MLVSSFLQLSPYIPFQLYIPNLTLTCSTKPQCTAGRSIPTEVTKLPLRPRIIRISFTYSELSSSIFVFFGVFLFDIRQYVKTERMLFVSYRIAT